MTRRVHDSINGERPEPPNAMRAFGDYLALGASRSLTKLWAQYRARSATDAPPTRRLDTLKTWSAAFKWQERISALEAEAQHARRQEYLRQAEQQAASNARLLQHVGAGALAVCALMLRRMVDQETGQLLGEVAARDLPRLALAGSELVQLATSHATMIINSSEASHLETVLRLADEDTRRAILLGMRAVHEWEERHRRG